MNRQKNEGKRWWVERVWEKGGRGVREIWSGEWKTLYPNLNVWQCRFFKYFHLHFCLMKSLNGKYRFMNERRKRKAFSSEQTPKWFERWNPRWSALGKGSGKERNFALSTVFRGWEMFREDINQRKEKEKKKLKPKRSFWIVDYKKAFLCLPFFSQFLFNLIKCKWQLWR